MPQTEIVRKDIFTVNKTMVDTYGNLVITTDKGVGYKIGKKREQLFPIFQPGAEVNVGFASYMNKEYIAEASQTGKHTVQPAVTPIVAAAQEIGTEMPTEKHWGLPNTNRSIERQVAAKLAMEFCDGTVDDRMAAAEIIFQWIHKNE